ncbi:MAG: ATP-binding cassette domain-containing protein [Puniceicoccales bacterium]|jgi:phospholipid/cholesterol/gamma-HCH transport system ATP-binding protein|nr:ATP-binding cassette domain-containing protein [Puniceicoccales bacterium]
MKSPKLEVKNLTMSYGAYVLMRNISFSVKSSEIFLIIGGSGCGKSTLLKYLIGLKECPSGKIFYDGVDITKEQKNFYGKFGVLYQSGALWSSLTIAENIALPFSEFTELSKSSIDSVVELKLSLVGLNGFGDFYPSQLSGGMKKRAGLARAMALDPDILFLDEPSAGLDPISAANLDDLILEIRKTFGTTIVIVTHDLDSIFNIGDRAIYLDAESKSIIAEGRPLNLRDKPVCDKVSDFLSRKHGDHSSR